MLIQQISPTGRVDGGRELAVFLGGDVFPVGGPERQPLPTPLDVEVAISRPAERKHRRGDEEGDYTRVGAGHPGTCRV